MLDSGQLTSWYENMTSSTKLQVHNISQHHQWRAKPWPQATGTKNLVKFGRVVFNWRQTDKWKDKQTGTIVFNSTCRMIIRLIATGNP